jgi:hypothetical protein
MPLTIKEIFLTMLCFGISFGCSFAQEIPQSGAGIIVDASRAVMTGSSGSALVRLTNSTSTAADLNLTMGPLVAASTRAIVSGAKVDFATLGGSASLPKAVQSGETVLLLANITGDSQPGLATAQLFNGGKYLGMLNAIRYDLPLKVAAIGNGTDTGGSPLQVGHNKNILVTIVNNDAIDYPLSISLSYAGVESHDQQVTLGPNVQTTLTFEAPEEWFDSTTWLRPYSSKIQVVIRLIQDASAIGAQKPPRAPSMQTIPLAAQLLRFRPWVSSVVVVVVLLIGALSSLAVNSLLPSVMKKLAYKKKLQVLADGTSAVSMRVDSRLRVILRVERNRLVKLLASANAFALDTNDVYRQLDVALDALGKRLSAAQRLDDLRYQFELHLQTCPPSVADSIDQDLQNAADQLRSLFLTDKNVDNATTFLDSGEAALGTLDSSDAVAKGVFSRYKDLQARMSGYPMNQLADMQSQLPGVFTILSLTYDDTHPIPTGNMLQVDDSVARMNVILDYDYIRLTSTDGAIQARLDQHKTQLIQSLSTRDWRSLRASRDLIQEMRENIYVEDLWVALVAREASISLDQQVARPHARLEFCICFQKSAYDYAQAINNLNCEWDFGDALTEKDWAVCHFFTSPGERTVRATVPLANGTNLSSTKAIVEALADSGSDKPCQEVNGTVDEKTPSPIISTKDSPTSVQFEKQVVVRHAPESFSKAKWLADGLRFVIAFFLALVGLVAGAQDQIAKLDVVPALIAVLLLGFGADTIKNVLSQPSQDPQQAKS